MSGFRAAFITPDRVNAPGRWGVMDVYRWRREDLWPPLFIEELADIWSVATDQLHRTDRDGGRVWFRGSSLFSMPVRAVAVDADGYSYVAGGEGVRKVDPDGDEVWTYTQGMSGTMRTVQVAGDGQVYAADSSGNVHRIAQNGSQSLFIEQVTRLGEAVEEITVDANGFIYVGGLDDRVWKLDTDGEVVWEMTRHTNNVRCVAVDGRGNVYSGGSDNRLIKTDRWGDHEWTFTGHWDTVNGVAVDADGYVYTASSDGTVRKLSRRGREIWRSTRHSGHATAVAVDVDGNVFSGGEDRSVRRLNKDGEQVWSYTRHYWQATIRGIAVAPGIHAAGHGW